MIKSMLVIIAVVACVAVAHPQTFYPAAFSYQNSFVHHNRQPYVGRFTNAHISKQSATQRFFDTENQGMDRFTKQTATQRFMDNENQGKDRFEIAQFARQSTSQRDMVNDNQERDRSTNDQLTQTSPQRFMVNENQGMDRLTNAHFTKTSNFSQRDNKQQYDQLTAQRNDEDNDRASF